jgi:hypothetical protein
MGNELSNLPVTGRSLAEMQAWLADNSLNVWAYLSLLAVPPMKARHWVGRIALLYRSISSIEDARRMVERLGGRGTCLSRSLAVAARCRGSDVVIGVEKRNFVNGEHLELAGRRIEAHAWVEMDGATMIDHAKDRWVEVGRLGATHPNVARN